MTIISIAALAAASLFTYNRFATGTRIADVRGVIALFLAIAQGLWMIIDALQNGVRPGGSVGLRRPGIQVAADVAE